MNVYRLISPNIGNTVPAEHETPAALLNVISEMGPEHVASASNKGNDGRDLSNGNPWHTAISEPYSHLKLSDRQIFVVKLKFLSSWPFLKKDSVR